jgi:hypothetical protein
VCIGGEKRAVDGVGMSMKDLRLLGRLGDAVRALWMSQKLEMIVSFNCTMIDIHSLNIDVLAFCFMQCLHIALHIDMDEFGSCSRGSKTAWLGKRSMNSTHV